MHFKFVCTVLLRPVVAVAVILLPVILTFGWLGLLGAPLVLAGLVLASPGLAAMHAFERRELRYHLVLGAAVGTILAVAYASFTVSAGTDPHDVRTLTLRVASLFASLGGAFGAWSGFIWWAFCGRRPPEAREPASPQCRVSAAIE